MAEIAYKPIEKLSKIYTGGTLTPPKFMPTLYEWLSSKGKQIFLQSGSNVNGFYTLFTVPENKILYITSAFINAVGADSTTNYIRIKGSSYGEKVIAQAIAGNSSVSFSIPLKILSGVVIEFNVNGGHTSAGFAGFLSEINDIPAF